MKIRTRLMLILSTLPLLIALFVGTGWFQSTSLNKVSDTLQNKYELSFLAEKIHIDVKNEAIDLRNIAIYKDKDKIQKEQKKIQGESEAINQNIALIEPKLTTNDQIKLVENLKKTNDHFNQYKDKVINLVLSGDKAQAIQLMDSDSSPIQDEFFQEISKMTSHFETDMDTSLGNVSQSFTRQMLIGSIISLIALIIVAFLVFKSIWAIAMRLNKVSQVMKSVASGHSDLTTRVEVKSNDEIDDVANSFNQMVESLEEQVKKEQGLIWSKSHIAEITTELNGRHDLESLSQTFLSKVAPLIEAAHAVLYVKDIDEVRTEPIYRLLSTYALKIRKHMTNVFHVGEGLIGQAVFEKKPILLTKVPADYVQVKSGLGEATPLNIYVLPICFEGDVKAVLEMASFKEFSSEQQSFLEEMINSLGIIFDSVIGRIKLAKLLEESQALTEEVQAQSEELQTQQEELRATNEELEEQTRALRGSEEKLQVQHEELEEINAELKEKAAGLEEQNRKFEATNREVEKARSELEEKAKQLDLSSRYKSEFLANMSHELRTPLNSLLILSKLLSDNHDGNLTDKQVEYSKTIYSSGSDLLILINDVLDLAKIESGKMDVNPGEVLIKDIVDYVESTFRPVADEKKVDLNIVVEENAPSLIVSDVQRLQQVLRNLLSNAFKFTHKGEVTLEIDFNHDFSFSVIDTGIGIPEDKQELIFQAFQQADGTMSRRYGGTGLGLSICREIANLLGGRIDVESVEGVGSKFTFVVGHYQEEMKPNHVIHLDEVAATKEVAKDVQIIRSRVKEPHEPLKIDKKLLTEKNSHIKRLLIVDDDQKQRNSLMEFIGNKNVVIRAVSSGTEAIEELKVNQFDCMVLDLGLTDTDGFKLLEKIKASDGYDNLKVFIYTGRDLTTQEERSLNRRAYTIIIKDEQAPQRLKDELELYLNSGGTEEQSLYGDRKSESKKLTSLEGKRILLVDDDVRNVYALSSILELYGMTITFAENGKECLDMLEKGENFDLVLMDIMMPEMDGYEAIRRVREMPKFKTLPIIALTAKAVKEDREKCMSVGASDYIIKPVDPDQLISLIKVWLYQQ